jgi:hypothetical protein
MMQKQGETARGERWGVGGWWTTFFVDGHVMRLLVNQQ